VSSLGAQRRDRGATLPEYALIVGLVLVVCLTAISKLQRDSARELDERKSSSGASAELSGQGFTYSTGGGSSGGGTGGDPPHVVQTVDGVAFDKPTSKKNNPNPNWIATVTVMVSSGSTKVQNALVEVTFTHGTSSTTFTCPLASNDKGEVVCQLTGIPNANSSATMVVERVYGTNIAYTQPATKPTQSFAKP
jgi:hypothetical protein